MQRKYEDILISRMEKALDEGAALILWNELYRWYDVKKIAAATYRDIKEKWEELRDVRKGGNGTNSGTLMQVSAPSGIWIFSDKYLKPFGTESEE